MKPSGPKSHKTERLLALVAIALLLFCPPVILVVDRFPASHIGWLPVYLFGAWIVVIGLAAWLMEHHGER